MSSKKTVSLMCVITGLLLGPIPEVISAQSVLADLFRVSEAIVTVRAESGGTFGGKQQFLDPKTGRIVMAARIRPVYYKREGAGVIIDAAGIIVTNAHTVKNSGRVRVILKNDTTVDGILLKAIPENDLAFIKITPPFPLTAVHFADSDQLKPKNQVYCIGNSKLRKNSISQGKVKAIAKQKIETTHEVDVIQINFDIYEGDSGSPVFNEKGELLGIMNAKSTQTAARSFAIPANVIKSRLEELKQPVSH